MVPQLQAATSVDGVDMQSGTVSLHGIVSLYCRCTGFVFLGSGTWSYPMSGLTVLMED